MVSSIKWLVWRASPFPSIAQHRVRKRVWYNCYSGFVQDLTFGCLQSDCRTRKKLVCDAYAETKQYLLFWTALQLYREPMAARGERCRLCSKLVATKERRVFKGESSAPWEVLSCLLALSSSSGGTGGAADLIRSDSPQSFLCKRCFSEVERYLR